MFAIRNGNVPEYTGGIDPLIYLITSVDRLTRLSGRHQRSVGG